MRFLNGRLGESLEDSFAVAIHAVAGIVAIGILVNSQPAMRLDQVPVLGKVTQSVRWIVNQVYDTGGEA